MLRTRLWMGSILIGVAVLLLLEDRWFAPWFPIFYCCYLGASLLAVRELLDLLPEKRRPDDAIVLTGMCAFSAANWWPAFQASRPTAIPIGAGEAIAAVFLIFMAIATFAEMWRFRGPNKIVERLALTAFTFAYLGVLPSFLAQLRWLPDGKATLAVALTVFVPKCNDIGAYFTGKFLTGPLLGRTLMTPHLSPKKTWQGFAGGMLTSIGVAIGINEIETVLPFGRLGAVLFGLTVGVAGVLGDLAESLIKRDLQTKDASQSVPGFGGVLDVIDSLLFAAPVAWLWFR